jgi:hypothetical protein
MPWEGTLGRMSSCVGITWVMSSTERVVLRPVPNEREKSSKTIGQKVSMFNRRSSGVIPCASLASYSLDSAPRPHATRGADNRTRCRPRSRAIRTAIPVYIHISDSESADCQRVQRQRTGLWSQEYRGLPFERPRTARRVNADTVSRDGTAKLEARCVFARLANALPYSCGRRSDLAMAVCVENLVGLSISGRTMSIGSPIFHLGSLYEAI